MRKKRDQKLKIYIQLFNLTTDFFTTSDSSILVDV